jgi:hypothetical protein
MTTGRVRSILRFPHRHSMNVTQAREDWRCSRTTECIGRDREDLFPEREKQDVFPAAPRDGFTAVREKILPVTPSYAIPVVSEQLQPISVVRQD